MLIGKTFKADLDNQKGHLQASDLGALFAFVYPQKAGILNITGNDCSYNGYPVIVGNTAQITFNKGYIVIYGRAIYIEESTQVAFNLPTSGSVNGVLGVKVNLAENGANEVSWFQKTTTAQTDNLLTKEANGVYEFVLYNYTATSTTFVMGEKTKEVINGVDEYITDLVLKSTTEFMPLNLTANLQAESEVKINGSTPIALSGYGIKVLNRETQKYYWIGNLQSRFIVANGFNDLGRLSLQDTSSTQATITNIVDGGTFEMRVASGDYTGEVTAQFGGISIFNCAFVYYKNESGGKVASYRPNLTNQDMPTGYAILHITNMIIELN